MYVHTNTIYRVNILGIKKILKHYNIFKRNQCIDGHGHIPKYGEH